MFDGAIVDPKTSSRTTRTVSSDGIVGARVSTKTVGCADCNCRRLIAGRVYLPVNFFAVRVLAIITRGGYDDDAGIGSAAHCLAERVVQKRINSRRPDTHVDHAQVVDRAVGHYPIQGCQKA